MPNSQMRVLLAIDGSEPANLALDLVANIDWPAWSQITVATAVEVGTGLVGGPWPADTMIEQADAHQTGTEAQRRLIRPGLSVEAVVLHGRPATAIVDCARDTNADLVVVGSRGHGSIQRMLLGSVSAEVVDQAPAPVLVARGRRIERILLGWDGSTCAALAAELLCSWPIFAGSDVRVVSVATVKRSRRQHEGLVREMEARLQGAGLVAVADRRDGDAATEILESAHASEADLIVLGTHGRTGLKRLFLGSVARNVLGHAACSVLIVRDGPPPMS